LLVSKGEKLDKKLWIEKRKNQELVKENKDLNNLLSSFKK
jgi:hypothetical protein